MTILRWEHGITHKIKTSIKILFQIYSLLFLRKRAFQKGAFQPYYANSMLQNNVFAIWSKNHKFFQYYLH